MTVNYIDENLPFQTLNIAIVTISDTRTLQEDKSGDILHKLIIDAGHNVIAREIIIDSVSAIQNSVQKLANDENVQVIITTGGTGFTGRDVTPEAVEPLFAKKMDGFSAMFHQVSFKTIGMVTIQSRATAGLINATFVFCLPGSTGACKDAWNHILKGELDSRQQPHNLVLLMPRLKER